MPDHTRWLNGSSDARDGEQFRALYDELKKIARSRVKVKGSDLYS